MKILNKLVQQIQSIEGKEILAPIGDTIVVVVDGVRFSLPALNNPEDETFGVYEIVRQNKLVAQYKGQANRPQITTYLALLPTRYLIWLENNLAHRYGADQSEEGIYTCDLLYYTPSLFEVVLCRIAADKIFVVRSANRDTRVSVALREAFYQKQKMPRVNRFFTSAWEYKQNLFAVELAKQQAAMREAAKARAETHAQNLRTAVENALHFSGSQLLNMVELDGGTIVVEYRVPHVTRTFKSTISSDTFNVVSAGVCLNGNDSLYTLKTLPLIIQEGHKHGKGDWRRDWSA